MKILERIRTWLRHPFPASHRPQCPRCRDEIRKPANFCPKCGCEVGGLFPAVIERQCTERFAADPGIRACFQVKTADPRDAAYQQGLLRFIDAERKYRLAQIQAMSRRSPFAVGLRKFAADNPVILVGV